MTNKKELNDNELEDVSGGYVMDNNPLAYKKCANCKKNFKKVFPYNGKNYCLECYKELNKPLGKQNLI